MSIRIFKIFVSSSLLLLIVAPAAFGCPIGTLAIHLPLVPASCAQAQLEIDVPTPQGDMTHEMSSGVNSFTQAWPYFDVKPPARIYLRLFCDGEDEKVGELTALGELSKPVESLCGISYSATYRFKGIILDRTSIISPAAYPTPVSRSHVDAPSIR